LVIIADGGVSESAIQDTVDAIVEASFFPLSIICVGVGDGPFHLMHTFDDNIEGREFDNFQFVDFHSIISNAKGNVEVEFARNALMEIPDQYMAIQQLGYLNP